MQILPQVEPLKSFDLVQTLQIQKEAINRMSCMEGILSTQSLHFTKNGFQVLCLTLTYFKMHKLLPTGIISSPFSIAAIVFCYKFGTL